MEMMLWVLHQPIMIILYVSIVLAFVVDAIDTYIERKVKAMKISKALTYIAKIKLNWLKANQDQRNILYGLEFMQRSFDKGICDAIQVARTQPESVEEYMSKIHDELLGMCGTQAAEVLLDEVFDV